MEDARVNLAIHPRYASHVVLAPKTSPQNLASVGAGSEALGFKTPRRSSMSDHDVPVLCLLDELSASGFRAAENVCFHSRGAAKTYDSRKISSTRCYLQCLLSRDAIFRKGQRRFRSDQSQAYYKWLMRSRGPIPEQAAARDCQERLLQIEADGEEYKIDGALLAAPVAPAPSGGLLPVADVDGDDGQEDAAPPPPRPIADVDAPAVDGDGVDGGFEVPEFILGQPVSLEVHWRGGQGLRVQCPLHPGCSKYRSMTMCVPALGPAAAKHFLATWLAGAHSRTPEEHRGWRPTVAEIRQHLGDA